MASDSYSELTPSRVGCATGGVALLAFGLLSRGGMVLRGLSALAGAGLLYQALTGRLPKMAMTAGAELEPLTVSDSIRLDVGRDTTYRYWRNVQNLAAIMARVDGVEEIDDRRSRWHARTAEGLPVSWVSEITDDDPGKAIRWRSEDSPVPHEGVVCFRDTPAAPGTGLPYGTEVSVEMRYLVPRDARGEMARRALGDPQRDLHEALERLKRTLEEEDFLMTVPPRP